MDTIKLAVQKLGTQAAVAKYLGIGEGNMSKYCQRGYLPEHYWDSNLKGGQIVDLDLGVTYAQYITEGAIYRARRHRANLQGRQDSKRVTVSR
jgi:hypothetical protein